MNAIEVLRETLKNSNPEQVAAELGVTVSTLHKWSEAGESHRPNPLERVDGLMRVTRNRAPLHWLCERSGGYFVCNAKDKNHQPVGLLPEESQVIGEFGELISLISRAVEDGEVTPTEARDIRAKWERLKSVTEGFVAGCEAGEFRALKASFGRNSQNVAELNAAI